MKNMKKSLLAMVLALLCLVTSLMPAFAEDIPYDSYNYDYWNDIFRTPSAYVPQGKVLGTDLTWNGESLGAFVEPQDMFVAPNGDIYLADTNNNRIIVLTNDLRTVRNVITGFDNAGLPDQFNKPTGVCVTEDGWLYVADSQNKRIVVLDETGALRRIVEIPSQATTQTLDGVTYTIGTYVEGMDPLARLTKAADGTQYAVAALPEGSASTVTQDGMTYTVVAVADGLEPFENELLSNVAVSGTPVENGDCNDVLTFFAANDGDVMRITAADASVKNASGALVASTAYRVTDAQGALVVRAYETAEGVVFADKDNKDAARLNADGSISLFGADGAVSCGLKWNGTDVVFCDAKGKTVATSGAQGAVSFHDGEGTATLQLMRSDAGLILADVNGGELVLMKADGAIALRDAEGAEVIVLTLESGAVVARDSQGNDYPHQSKTRNGVTLKNEAGDTLASLDKNGLLALENAEGDKIASLAITEQGFVLNNDDGDAIAALTAEGGVSCVNGDGAEIARLGADGVVTVLKGADVQAVASGAAVEMNGAAIKPDGSAELLDASGAQIAVVNRVDGAAVVKENGGAQCKLLSLTGGAVALKDALALAGADGSIVALQEDGSSVTVTLNEDTLTYIAGAADAGVVRSDMSGEEVAFNSYDPNPDKDIFQLIGNLVNWMRGKAASDKKLTGVKGVWVDEDGGIYAVDDKGAIKLNGKGKLERSFAGYWPFESSEQTTFKTVSQFALIDEKLYLRETDNEIIVLDQDGLLQEIIANNAVQIRNADGEVVAVFSGFGEDESFVDITGVEVIGDKLFVGQKDGRVVILNMAGETLAVVKNDTIVVMDAQGAITAKMEGVVSGKTVKAANAQAAGVTGAKSIERFSAITGVAMRGESLCVASADNTVVVMNADGSAALTARNNCVNTSDGKVINAYDFNGQTVTFALMDGVEGLALNSVRATVPDPANAKKTKTIVNQLCIADSSDNMIVLNGDHVVTRVNRDADNEVLAANFDFSPKKVAVDYAGRLYCVVQHKVQGIMVFETNGDFTGFFGTIEVAISAWDKFWRKLATKEERSKQALFIPTEFTGIDIDQEGFVYATNVDEAGLQAVRRLNPKGEDVIRMGANANLGGDLVNVGTSQYAGVSKIVDVVYRGKGIYSLLDAKRGRIFTYDHEGNLLYIFGGLGSQDGTFSQQVEAIEYADGRILVLDRTQSSILVFGETKYGKLINDAVSLRYDGDEAMAVDLWKQVLELDENNELANTGIGKAYLSAGDNKQAMEYLERGMNKEYYSVAYKRYRNELLKDNIHYVLTGAVVLVAALVIYFKVIKPRLNKKREGRA